jgi:Flp pilus assembly CpaF family ATPase
MNLYCHHPVINGYVERLLPIGELLHNPNAQEISINSGGRVYVDWGSGAMREAGISVSDDVLRAVIRLLMAANGQYLDPAQPFATLSLTCGARFHGAIPPVASEAQVTIRTHHRILRPLGAFMEEWAIERLRNAVAERKSIVIGGPTSAGKTTLLNSLLDLIPYDQRLVIIQDAPEIQLAEGRHVVWRLVSDQADLKRHVFEALRDRPDWLIIGETRDSSARDLLDASRTGHPGLSTVHAASVDGIVTRLMSLANCDLEFVKEAISLVVFIQRMPDGRRAVTDIKEIK